MRVALRVAVAVVVAGGSLLASGAGASSPVPLECHAGGALTITGSEPANWSFVGSGTCVDGTPGGTRTVDIVGTGRSDNLGLCSGDLTLDNLNLTATVTLTDFGPVVPETTVMTQKWVMSVSTYPIVTPFLVKNTEPLTIGEGVISHHLVADCSGSPAFSVTWSFLR
jgi:hypothetical protein